MGPRDGPQTPRRSSRPGEAVALLDRCTSRAPVGLHGGPEMAPNPQTFAAPRRSRGASLEWLTSCRASRWPPRPPTLVAPRRSRGAPRPCGFLLEPELQVDGSGGVGGLAIELKPSEFRQLGGQRRVGLARHEELQHAALRRARPRRAAQPRDERDDLPLGRRAVADGEAGLERRAHPGRNHTLRVFLGWLLP